MLNDPVESVSVREANNRRRRQQLAQAPRRKYSLDFKLQVVEETFAAGASVPAVALRHNMNTNVVFRWRKLFREGRLTGAAGTDNKTLPSPAFAPVRVVANVPALPAPKTAKPVSVPDAKPPPRKKSGVMAITLPGGATLRVDADIDEAALRRALLAVRDMS